MLTDRARSQPSSASTSEIKVINSTSIPSTAMSRELWKMTSTRRCHCLPSLGRGHQASCLPPDVMRGIANNVFNVIKKDHPRLFWTVYADGSFPHAGKACFGMASTSFAMSHKQFSRSNRRAASLLPSRRRSYSIARRPVPGSFRGYATAAPSTDEKGLGLT